MSSYTTPARVRFPRSSVTGKVPDTVAPGSFAINWTDQKIYVGDAAGNPVRFTQWLTDWSPVLNYRDGDFVIFENALYRARRDLTSGTPFSLADWEPVSSSARGETAEPFATSILSGGATTLVGGDTLEVTAGTGIIVNASNPASIDTREFGWSQFTYTIGTAGEPWTVVGINPDDGVTEVTLEQFTPEWRRKNVMLVAVLWDLTNGGIAALIDASVPAGGTAEAFRDKYFAEGGAFRANGLRVKASTGMTLALTGGTLFDLGGSWRTTPYSPNTIPVAAQDPLSLSYTTRDRVVADQTTVDPTQWDNLGTLQAVPAGNATIQYMSIGPTGRTFVQYGQRLYPSINAALAAIADDWDLLEPYSLTDPVVGLAALVATPAATATATDVFIIPAALHGDPYASGAQAAGDTSQFLLLDGSRQMLGPLDMGGQAVENASIYGGTATSATVDPFVKIRAKNSTTAGAVPATTAAADRGELFLNLADRKVYGRDASGAPVLVADRITDFSATGVYAVGDFVVQAGTLYRANVANGPGAFTPSNWTALGGGGGGGDGAILTHPTTATRNTIDLNAAPAVKGLVIDGAPNQTANLLEIPGTSAADTRSAVIDPQGFPNDRFGPAIFRVAQATHGFSAIGQAVAFNAGVWVKANAASATTRALALIEQIIDANTFVLRTNGRITQLQTGAFAGGSITSGTMYYVSDTVAGQLTPTVSAIRPDPVLYTTGTSSGIVLTGTGSTAVDFVRKTGDTMTGPLTLAGTNEVRFVDGNTSIYKQSSTPSILVEVAGQTAARFDENDDNAGSVTTVMTRRKADARYLMDSETTAFAQAVLRMVYPVGALYYSTSSTNPSSLFPGTTWEAYAAGRAIVGVGTADSTAWTVGQTRGEADVALGIGHLPSHTHSVDPPSTTTSAGGNHDHGGATATGGQHNHQMWDGTNTDVGTFALRDDNTPRGTRGWTSNGTTEAYFDNFQGNSQDWWTRGASNKSAGDAHTHGIADSGTHTHTLNIAAFNSGAAGSGTSHNNIQPSIAVYIFRRTA